MARLIGCLMILIWIAVPSRAAEKADVTPAKDQPAAAEAAAETGAVAAGIRAVAGRFDEGIAKAAAAHGLPHSFFARLIWQESRFDPNAVSPVGALGIAQFMPDTARWRGLGDPLEPMPALHESARWLRELWSEFGNLGLAAAAYNAGPGRVKRWLAGSSLTIPAETRDYVRIVTGHDAETWRTCSSLAREDASHPGRQPARCPAHFPPAPAKERLATRGPGQVDQAAWAPWGLQLIGDWSEARALSEYKKLQARFPQLLGDRKPLVIRGSTAGRGSAPWYRVRVAESNRARADELCARLERAGGRCLVFRN